MEQYLFVIDYQNDFVDGALGFPGAEQLDEGIAEKIRSYAPGHVIFTRDTHQENYLETREGKLLPVKHCVQGSHGWALTGRPPRPWPIAAPKASTNQLLALTAETRQSWPFCRSGPTGLNWWVWCLTSVW